jgi:hypothetical protein
MRNQKDTKTQRKPASDKFRVVVWILAVVVSQHVAYGQDWRPVTPPELKSEAAVEKTADAEALFWDVHIEQSESKTVLSHYIRIKIFTDHGVETQGRVDLPYAGRNSIKDIHARTIQADGSAIELKPDAIFERSIVKSKKVKVQAKSFALPSVKPGVLIDYQWTEVMQDVDPFHLALVVQRDIPVQFVRFSIKPMSGIIWPLRITGFNVRPDEVATDKHGIQAGVIKSIPAFHEEPMMPPEAAVRPWLLIFYDYPGFWTNFGSYIYESVKPRMKVTDEIRQEAARLVAKASDVEDKVRRLYEFCRTEIRRIDDDAAEDAAQRAADLEKENKIPADTLKRKAGTGKDIDFLFAALASAAGFDVRYAVLSDRGRFFFEDRYPARHMLVSYNIAVRLNDRDPWRFFDPAGRYLSFGMLRWQEEGMRALLVGPDRSQFETTPFTAAEKSLLKRFITGRLDPDGTLDGDVRMIFFGHTGAEEKAALDGLSPNDREEYIKKAVQRRMDAAEISNIQLQNVTDPAQPIVESYHVRVPGYAQRIGKRLILEPGYFQHGRTPLFSSSTRIQPVYFPYPWTEDDMVVLDLPPGFVLDNADQPSPEAASGSTVKHEMHIRITTDGRTLRYTRRFSFGTDEKILFQVSEYPSLKAVLDLIDKRDAHSIAIKEVAPQEDQRP